MRISDWSSDVCSSDLIVPVRGREHISRAALDNELGNAGHAAREDRTAERHCFDEHDGQAFHEAGQDQNVRMRNFGERLILGARASETNSVEKTELARPRANSSRQDRKSTRLNSSH